MCQVIPQISPSSRSNVLQLDAAEVLCTLWPSLKMNVPQWLYQVDKQQEWNSAVTRLGKRLERRSGVIKAFIRSSVKEDCDRFAKNDANMFHSPTAHCWSKRNVEHSDSSAFSVSSVEAGGRWGSKIRAATATCFAMSPKRFSRLHNNASMYGTVTERWSSSVLTAGPSKGKPHDAM